MKTKASLTRSLGLCLALLLAAFQTTSFAADVTGARLNIGAAHTLGGTNSSIAGGYGNVIPTNSNFSFVGAGYGNGITGSWSVLAGGFVNSAMGGDLNFVGGGQLNSITGNYSTIGGGYSNSITNDNAVVAGGYANNGGGYLSFTGGGYLNVNQGHSGTIGGGTQNSVSGSYSTIAGGVQANAPLYGQSAHASGAFVASGDAQASEYVLRRIVTTTNATELFLDNSSARMTIPSGATWAFDILVAARSSTNSAGYQIKGVIKNNSGTTALVGSATTTTLGEDVASWNATASASNTNSALVINVTGDASTNRWVATVRTTEVKF